MASNGLHSRAKNGKCRICHRTRSTGKYVKAVGEVNHGYATGHIWECRDIAECEKVARQRLNENRSDKNIIEIALRIGRFKEYVYYS
jgi:hypothetical protein